MNRPLSRQEERAEAALWRAQHPVALCSCQGGYVFCLVDRCTYPEQRRLAEDPDPAVLAHLIERGRIYP